MGFNDTIIDQVGNVIGHVQGKSNGKKILFDAHLDTVPVSDETKWTHHPFKGEIAEDKIYGRGASDMKGQLSAMLSAIAFFKEDFKDKFSGDIYLVGTVLEEVFEGMAARHTSDVINPDMVVIGEATDLDLAIGQRGRAEILLETFGRSTHSSSPEKGINAVYKMLALLQEVRKLEPINHPLLGKGILELTDIKSFPYPGVSVIPEYCKVTLDRRVLYGETKKMIINTLERLIEKMKKIDINLNAKVTIAEDEVQCYTDFKIKAEKYFRSWIFDKDQEFIQKALTGLESMGLNSKITYYSFCTNGSYYAGEKGIPTVGFGPSKEYLAHVVDEYMEIDQLFKGTEGYYGILKSFFNII